VSIFLLTNPDRVKRLIDKSKADDDQIFQSLIEEVSAAIAQRLNRHILIEERTEFYDVDKGAQAGQLWGYPFDLSKTFEVFNDSARNFGSTTEITGANLIKYNRTGMIEFDHISLSHGRQTLKVTYTGGHSQINQ